MRRLSLAGEVRRSPVRAVALLGLGGLFALLMPSSADGDVLQAPNLTPLAPYQIGVGYADEAESFEPGQPRAIRFSISSVNQGGYSLELFGDPNTLTWAGLGPMERDASQCVWWISRVCTHRAPVGKFVWHDAHEHWHFENYARYELRRLRNGVPDMTPGGLVLPGQKASFCLLDFWQADTTPSGHDPLASAQVYRTCTDYVQGISPGWADEYYWGLAGQQIPIPSGGIASGDYALMVTVNPDHQLYETSFTDNAAYTVVRISNGGETLKCPLDPQVCGFDDEF